MDRSRSSLGRTSEYQTGNRKRCQTGTTPQSNSRNSRYRHIHRT